MTLWCSEPQTLPRILLNLLLVAELRIGIVGMALWLSFDAERNLWWVKERAALRFVVGR